VELGKLPRDKSTEASGDHEALITFDAQWLKIDSREQKKAGH
jgi:hypothetical protein